MEVPRITKITLNMGLGEAVGDKKIIQHAMGDMEKIAGQKPVATLSRKSIAGFRFVITGQSDAKVTLRRAHMYEFLDRLINIAIRVSVTSVVLAARLSMVVATTAWAFRNRSCSLRSITTRSMRYVV